MNGARPLLYCCAPVRTATVIEKLAVEDFRSRAFGLGYVPVWGPSVLGGLGLTDERDRSALLRADLAMLDACEALAIVGARITEGMDGEIRRALRTGKPIYFAEDLPAAGSRPTTSEKIIEAQVKGIITKLQDAS